MCPPPPGYTFIGNLPPDQRVRGMVAPSSKAQCEVGSVPPMLSIDWWTRSSLRLLAQLKDTLLHSDMM